MTGSIKRNDNEPEPVTKLTYEEACKKAFGWEIWFES